MKSTIKKIGYGLLWILGLYTVIISGALVGYFMHDYEEIKLPLGMQTIFNNIHYKIIDVYTTKNMIKAQEYDKKMYEKTQGQIIIPDYYRLVVLRNIFVYDLYLAILAIILFTIGERGIFKYKKQSKEEIKEYIKNIKEGAIK